MEERIRRANIYIAKCRLRSERAARLRKRKFKSAVRILGSLSAGVLCVAIVCVVSAL